MLNVATQYKEAHTGQKMSHCCPTFFGLPVGPPGADPENCFERGTLDLSCLLSEMRRGWRGLGRSFSIPSRLGDLGERHKLPQLGLG